MFYKLESSMSKSLELLSVSLVMLYIQYFDTWLVGSGLHCFNSVQVFRGITVGDRKLSIFVNSCSAGNMCSFWYVVIGVGTQ